MVENGNNMKAGYIRTEWKNNVTPVNAKNMNHIECGIEELYEKAIEYNQILAKDGLYIEQDSGKNIRIGQNIIFTNRIPENPEPDIVYYIVDSEARLKGIVVKGRFMDTATSYEPETEYNIEFSSDLPGIIEYLGSDVEVNLSWNITDSTSGEQVTPDSLEILKDGEPLENITGETVLTSVNKLGDTVFSLVAHFLGEGLVLRKELIITQTYYSYIGFAKGTETVAEMKEYLSKVLIPDRLTLDGNYKNDNFSDNLFTVCVPENLALGIIKVSGIEVPVEDPVIDSSTGLRYRVYRSSNYINPLSELELTGEIYTENPEPPMRTDYYIGWCNMSSIAFSALTGEDLMTYTIGYNIDERPTYSNIFGENSLFFLAYTDEYAPVQVIFTSGGQDMIQNFPGDSTANHESIMIEGKLFKIWGISHPGYAEYSPEDRITINFK